MKKILYILVFCFVTLTMSAQGSKIISHILTSDNLYYMGSLQESSGNVYQKLKVEIFGGYFAASASASDTYSINTRGENIINMERTGGSSLDAYDLKVYKNGTQFDFVVQIKRDHVSLFVQSWLIDGPLDQITSMTPVSIVKYDSSGKTDVTATFPKRVISATDAYGNIGIGTLAPQAKLDVNGIINGAEVKTEIANLNYINLGLNTLSLSGLGFNRNAKTGTILNTSIPAWQFTSRPERFALEGYNGALNRLFAILPNGNFGIGTNNPDQKLTVKGKIHAEEVLIDLNVPLADYVFKQNYKLMPLNELEQFVQTNSHLPEIPSAEEVAEKGLSIGEMQNKLLQKIEELTLYIIDQNKEIKALKEENKEIKNQLKNK